MVIFHFSHSSYIYWFSSFQFSHSVMPDSLRPHGLQPTRLLCPWDFPGKDTGVGRSIQFLSFIEHIFAWNVPLVSLIFLKRSLLFPILFSSTSLHQSLRKAFLSLLAILWNSAFKWVYLSFSPLLFTPLLFTAICKASSDSHFAFLHFFFLGMVLIPVSCTMSWTSIHSSSGTPSIKSNPLNLFLISTVQS